MDVKRGIILIAAFVVVGSFWAWLEAPAPVRLAYPRYGGVCNYVTGGQR